MEAVLHSDYPFIVRDITTGSPDAVGAILLGAGKYWRRLWLIDEFKPKNNKTYRIIFQSKYRSLTNDEINETMSDIEKSLKASCPAN